MTRLPLQQTRYQRLQQVLLAELFAGWGSSWRERSLQLLALLGAITWVPMSPFTCSIASRGRPSVVLVMVLLVELLVRLRSRFVRGRPPLGWMLIDNLRLGAVYSVVLEAFKLGT